jgi:polyketide synthase PksJ
MTDNKIDRRNLEDMMGLTSMQEGMLFHYLTNPESNQYFEQFQFNLSGDIKHQRFKETWKILAESNEMLRSVFRWEKLEEPVQLILKKKETPIRFYDLTGQITDNKDRPPEESIKKSINYIVKKDREQPVVLTEAPFRVTLCKLTEDRHLMLLTFHHIVLDGWSTGILLGEFLEVYRRLSAGETVSPEPKTRYKEFYKWYRRTRETCAQQNRESWEKELKGFDTRTLLPYDEKKLRDIQTVSTQSITIPSSVRGQLEECAREQNTTISILLYVSWGILLQKTNNSDDIIFGTTVSGRPPGIKDIEKIVGLFINTLPLRMQAHGDTVLSDLIKNVAANRSGRSDDGGEHVSLTDLKQMTGLGSDTDLFDSIVVVDNYPLDNMLSEQTDPNQISVTAYDLFEMTHFDLTLQIMMLEAGQIRLDFHYNGDCFAETTISKMARHYVNILQGIGDGIDAPISKLDMLDEEEKRQILEKFNRTGIRLVGDKTIHGIISDQAERNPENRALQYEDQWLTYRQLDRQANRLAHYLAERGVSAEAGSRVAMMFPRSIEMIVALLGILKAGAACIPLDTSYPAERNGFIIRDSEAGYYLTSLDRDAAEPISLDSSALELFYDPATLAAYPAESPETSPAPVDLSYIIYTSGSTGNPKGALLHHSGIVNHTYTKIDVLEITANDTVANNFSINVIAAVWQILSPLFMGGRLLLYSDEIEWDPFRQFQRAAEDGVTVIEVIPSVLKAFLFILEENGTDLSPGKLKKIALTSEETKPVLVNQFYKTYPHIDLVDCYGQTECCDDVLHYTVPCDVETVKVPIGYPSRNTNVVILNHHHQLQPVGIVGEICVVGAGVSYGYWKRPELNREKFVIPAAIENLFSDTVKNENGHDYFYRTGDLGRWMPDGKVEYLGRIDHQVKIRGNRVELREIENHLLRYPAIKEAAVVDRENREGEKNLFAFVVSEQEITTADIRQFLLKTLPDYMIPAYFIPMEKLPLTPNGKIDRKKLVKTEVKGSASTGTAFTPPRSDIERKIQAIWARLLDKVSQKDNQEIGINDNFFDLGGHSLLLIKLKSKLEKTFDLETEFPITELFNHPTIALQAGYILAANDHSPENNSTDAGNPEESARFTDIPSNPLCKDLAVIGISLKIPGARTIDEFWKNISDGVESISFFTDDELENCAGYRLIEGLAKRVPAAGVMGDAERFDADFFGYTPREAEIMDPQQRIFLEHAWMALEDAGYVGDTYPGAISVYAGVGWNTYLLNQVLENPGVINAMGEFQTMLANDKDFLATRVSYKLNLKGPSFTVQTACSTSLVAVHLARQGLLTGDCDIALAGGVMVRLPEKTGYFYTEGGHLSPDGHCRAFDAAASGTVFSNGIGIAVIKRLDDAQRDGDNIYAIIKGSAINNDGSLKVGFTSPSEIQQSKVISAALKNAGVNPHTVGYIETHGTGTILGDPVEIAALKRAFQTAASGDMPEHEHKKQYCAVGSVKANVGHMDAAAGIIGFIKAVLCLNRKQIPPSINFDTPNPIINFADSPFYVNRELKDWPVNENDAPRRAGVSSLGIGGTNAHIVLEEYSKADEQSETPSREFQLLLLSAKTESSLERMSSNLADYLRRHREINIADVAYTLQVGRAGLEHRKMIVTPTENIDDAVSALENHRNSWFTPDSVNDRPVIFMFPGQGSQYENMGLQLYWTEPIFREEADRCFHLLKSQTGTDIKAILYPQSDATSSVSKPEPGEARINQTEITQPVLFVFEYAMAKLLMNWGIKPYAMIGHSIGEFTAACLSGALALEDALKLVAARGRLMQQMPSGSMLSINRTEKEVMTLLKAHNDLYKDISLAAVNSSNLCVVSGPHDVIHRLDEQLKEKEFETTRLHTSHAFHSAMMDPVLEPLKAEFAGITVNNPLIPYISNVTGDWITRRDLEAPDYWGTHCRGTVHFSKGLEKLLALQAPLFLEVGPGKALSTFVRKHTDKNEKHEVIDTVRHPKKIISDHYYLHDSLGQLWCSGVKIDWNAFHTPHRKNRVPLPPYPFEGKPFLLQSNAETGNRADLSRTAADNPQQKSEVDNWVYIPAWKQSIPALHSITCTPDTEENHYWLCFLDDENTGIGRQLTDLIQAAGNDNIKIIGVKAGDRFEPRYRSDSNGSSTVDYEIRPGRFEDYEALMEDLQEREILVDKIIHLWTLTTATTAQELPDTGVYSLLNLVKAMGKRFMFNPMELWLISCGQAVIESSDQLIPENAALSGPLKVIPQEHPNISVRSIDLKPASNDIRRQLRRLITDLTAQSGSNTPNTVAYRGNLRWEQIYEPITLTEPDTAAPHSHLRQKGVYMIIGGLGKIGLTLAGYLAKTARARLVLTTLPDFPVNKQQELEELEKMGAEVMVLMADIADKTQMQKAISDTEARFGQLNGVIHAAGMMDDGIFKTIGDSDADNCRIHLKPKVNGLFVLEEILRNKELDFVILNSSLSSILGGLTLFAYSAANGFLDAFARKMNLIDQKNWFCINWDEWKKEISQTAPGRQVVGGTHSGLSITPEEGQSVFGRLLEMNSSMKNSPDTLSSQFIVSTSALLPRLRQWVLSDKNNSEPEDNTKQKKDFHTHKHQRPNLRNIYEAPDSEAEKIIAEVWEELLGIDGIGVHDDFFELGGHSLLATKLIARLREIFRIDIPLDILFDKPTVREVLDNIQHSWGDRETVDAIAQTYREVQQMS